tara:strand:- start:2339 stop:3055 length:717 start_codon:yes stop_codon:yes gene_type:complete
MERDSMVIYKSFYEAIKDLDTETKVQIYDAIYQYGLFLIEPKRLKGVAKIVWTLIKPQLDANIKKYQDGKKGAKHGSKGGRPKKPHTVNNKNPLGVNSKNPIRLESKTPNVNVNVNDNDNVNDNVNKELDFSKNNLNDLHKHLDKAFQLDGQKKLRNNLELYRMFLKWIVYRGIDRNNLPVVEMTLKIFIRFCKNNYTTDSIIAATEYAMLENNKTIHPKEKIDPSMTINLREDIKNS